MKGDFFKQGMGMNVKSYQVLQGHAVIQTILFGLNVHLYNITICHANRTEST